MLLAFLFVALSGGDYGLTSLFAGVGPLFWVVFWIGFYLLLLRFFCDGRRAISIRPCRRVRPPMNGALTTAFFFGLHNSFWVVFAGLEAVFLALCYAFYFMQNRAA